MCFISVQINDIGGERMKLSTLATLDYGDVCSDTVSVPSSEYHVLVKSGVTLSLNVLPMTYCLYEHSFGKTYLLL